MAPSKPEAPASGAKKRRSFFSSNLALMPKLPTPSTTRAPTAPRAQVLAALSAPEDAPTNRRNVPRAKAPDAATPTSTDTLPAPADSNSRRPRRRSPPNLAAPPLTPISPTDVVTGGHRLRTRPSIKYFSTGAEPLASVQDAVGSAAKPSTLLKTPTSARKRKAIPSSAANTPQTSLFEPKTGKTGKDAHAQSVNERLSQMMLASMRATIQGRSHMYERVPVYTDKKRGGKRVPGPTTHKRSFPLTARQKAKQKAKDMADAADATEEELYEDVEDDLVDDAVEVEEELLKDKGKGKASDKGKGRANEMTPKSKGKGKIEDGNNKEYMTSGFYCQDANAKSPFKLVNKVLSQSVAGPSRSGKRKAATQLLPNKAAKNLSFPPLPYDHGFEHFFGREHEFVLPYNIHKEATSGALNDKKKPAPYQKIRGNVFPERARQTAKRALCKCDPESGCGDNCINRIMSYLCGKDCPCGESCTNRSLAKRPMAETKVKYTGSRGFGLFAVNDIKEGSFVIDYRGEVISLNMFYQRIGDEYAGQKNYYALAYNQDEVIDSGMRGNDARFINHGCEPNLEVKRYQTLGDGLEEYEIGMWAMKDIAQGEELFYNYNFEFFGEAKDSLRAQCRCGAPTCIGYLGRKMGEQSGKDIALEVESKKAAEAVRNAAKGRKGKKVVAKIAKKAIVKFNGAVDRAKKTLATRTTKASMKASQALSDEVEGGEVIGEEEGAGEQEAEHPDEDQLAIEEVELEGVDQAPTSEAGNTGLASDWVDIPMDEDIEVGKHASLAKPAADMLTNRAIDSPSDNGQSNTATMDNRDEADFCFDQTTNDHPDGLVQQMINQAVEPAVETTSKASSVELMALGSASLMQDSPQIRSDTNHTSPKDCAPDLNSRSEPAVVTLSTKIAGTSAAAPAASADAPANSNATSSLGKPDANGRVQPIITPGMTPAEVAAAKRKSGWANWLRKIAAEKTRTLEEWHEERIKRRRGITWMNMMIAEFGVAPSPVPASVETYFDGRKPAGSIGSFANSLAAQGHGPGPEGVRNLGGPKNQYRSDNFKKTKEQQMKAAQNAATGGSANGSGASADGASPVAGMTAISPSGWTPHSRSDGSPSLHRRSREAIDEDGSEKRAKMTPVTASRRSVLDSSTILAQPPPTGGSQLVREQSISAPYRFTASVADSRPAFSAAVPHLSAHSGNFWRTAPVAPPLHPSSISPPAQSAPPTRPPESTFVATPHTPKAGLKSTYESVPTSKEKSTKRKAIERRNGAPMGWVYAPVEENQQKITEDVQDLPRSARRARQSMGRDVSVPISQPSPAERGVDLEPAQSVGETGAEIGTTTLAADGASHVVRAVDVPLGVDIAHRVS